MVFIDAPKRLLDKIKFNGFFVVVAFPTYEFDNLKGELSITKAVFAFMEQWYDSQKSYQARMIFLEILQNAAEWGNHYDPSKMITVGIWVGELGVVLGVRDEGDFFQKKEIKQRIWQRRPIPSTRPPKEPGGVGLRLGLYSADHLGIGKDGAIFFAVLLKEND